MEKRNARRNLWRRLTTLRRCAGRLVLALLIGCRSAALPYTTDTGPEPAQRGSVLAQQLMDDSARAVAQRPLGSIWELLWEIADHFWAMGEGGLGKRLLLPLRVLTRSIISRNIEPDSIRCM